ncbi:MAG: DsbA family protein [Beijerinckiaceae bacterium]
MPEIVHYFAPVSGYAYLGCSALLDIARASGARVVHRPVDIARVFAEGGSTPPVKQSDARRAWRARDMQMWAARRNLPLNARPKHWPTDGAPAARAIVALQMLHGPVDAFVSLTLEAVWARDLDIADPAALRALLAEAGADPGEALACADGADAGAAYEANTAAAIAAGAFGSPTYIVDGQFFFGQDRLDFVQAALEAGA